METFAWIGVGIAALIITVPAAVALIEIIREPLGRAILFGWLL